MWIHILISIMGVCIYLGRCHEIYNPRKEQSAVYIQLSTPGGIQECIEACNKNRKCGAFAWISSGQCWVEDPGGNVAIAPTPGLMIMEKKRENECRGCPWDFVTLGLEGGCYYIAMDRLYWHDAEAACQELDPRAHLISINDEKVSWTPSNLLRPKSK